jgi:hypothetical protein
MKILTQIALGRIFRQPLPGLGSMSLNAYRSAASIRSASEIEKDLAAKHLKNDPEYIIALLNEGRITLDFVDKKLITENVGVRQIGLQLDGLGLKLVPTHLQTRDDVLAAVESNGLALQFAKPEFTSDKDILKTAVLEHGSALEFVDKSIIKDNPELYFDLVDSAVRNIVGHALKFVDKSFIKDNPESYFEIVSDTVKRNGLKLEHASNDLKGDPEIVLAAIKQNGLALAYASEELRNDPEIVKLAYHKNPESLQFASFRLNVIFKSDVTVDNSEINQNKSDSGSTFTNSG